MRFGVGVLVVAAILAGCAGQPRDVVAVGDRFVAPGVAANVEDYRLGAGDKLKITVFNEPTLSGEFAVSADGNLSLPLINDLPVLGLSAARVADKVREKLAEGYLRDPKVSAEIINYRPFFILGEVKTPGQFPYSSGMTVLNAIALAQGFSPRAQRSVVYIRRAGSNEEVSYKLTPDLRVWPGDTIRLVEKYF